MPTLSEIRDELKYYSGRYDLTDARLDFFIQRGQDFLDNMRVLPQRRVTNSTTLVSGSYFVELQGLLKLYRVWITDSDSNIVYFPEYLEFFNFIQSFPDYVNASTGIPSHYTNARIPHDTIEDDIRYIFTPAFDGEHVLNYTADLKQSKLVNDSDENVWSTVYDDLLLDAAQMMIEKRYRNTEGVRDFIEVIGARVAGVDAMSAGQEDPGYEELQG